jgi:dipeptidase E
VRGSVSPPVQTAPRDRRIFAMGGGGFTMEPTNPLLDDYVLSLARAPRPRILFLPTAAGDTTGQINAFYARFAGRGCVPEHLSLFRLAEVERPLAEIVGEQDIVYAGGGSMRNLLAIWRAHELDTMLVDAWRRGTVLAGLSAGAMCWFQGGVTRSSGPPAAMDGLGLLRGSLTVHADGEPERLPVWLAAVRSGALPGGWSPSCWAPTRGVARRTSTRTSRSCDASTACAGEPRGRGEWSSQKHSAGPSAVLYRR